MHIPGFVLADLVVTGATALVVDWRESAQRDAWLLIADGRVQATGTGSPPLASTSVDASGMLLTPGFVAAHHHLYQGISRGVHAPGGLIDWLDVHYRAWARMSAEDVGLGALLSTSMALLGGCTTVAGFEYLHPPDEDFVTPVVDAAQSVGIRLLYVRGCAPRLEGPLRDRLETQGVAIDRLVEPEDVALERTEHTLSRATGEHLRWATGPTTPVVDDGGAFHRALDEVAIRQNTWMHTHFHPIPGTCNEGESGFEMAQRVGLVRHGNWLAHGSRLTSADVAQFGQHGMGIVHNPSCSVLLNYPTPPLAEWMRGNDRIAVSVDGAASNDRGGMLAEAQLAWQLQRAGDALGAGSGFAVNPAALLDAATRGGASAINWAGLGTLAPGNAADFALWDLTDIGFAGTPRSAADVPDWLVARCYSGAPATHVFVAGQPVVVDGSIPAISLTELAEQSREAATRLYG